MNFENLTVGLYVFIISSMLVKFQENKKLIVMSSINCLNLKFLRYKFCIKNNLIDRIVN